LVFARLKNKDMKKVIGWWSGGIASAVVCRLIIDDFGKENCRIIMIDTMNEDPDTYRFMMDCEKWYGVEIETIRNEEYDDIREVWYKHKSLNVSFGAICSSELKRKARKEWQKENDYSAQAFGFDTDEINRALSMKLNNPDVKPIFPLLNRMISKDECVDIVKEADIEIPNMYKLGFQNNNCFQTGCVQGGIGYWQKMGRDHPEKFHAMAKVEHEITDLRGEQVTMLKDQSNEAKKKPKKERYVFLKPHPDYPNNKDISQMEGREPKSLVDCNGFCGIDDLEENEEDQEEINYQTQMEF